MTYSVIIDREQTGFRMERVYVVKTGGDPELDRLATIGCPDGRDEQIATAHLFASAPELLAVLESSNAAINAMAAQVDAEWRNHDKAGDLNDKIVRSFREKARAAIAKARAGEA